MAGDRGGALEQQFVVGMALWRQGDVESAEGAFRSCMAVGDPEWTPRAAAVLGDMLWQQDQRLVQPRRPAPTER